MKSEHGNYISCITAYRGYPKTANGLDMSINPSTLAAFNEFKQENRAYHNMKDIYLGRLERLADENLYHFWKINS